MSLLMQFERTLIVADEDSQVSYLEGCTAPSYDKNQVHFMLLLLLCWSHHVLHGTSQSCCQGCLALCCSHYVLHGTSQLCSSHTCMHVSDRYGRNQDGTVVCPLVCQHLSPMPV